MSSPEIGITNYLGIALAVGFLLVLLAAIIPAARQIRHIRSGRLKWILLTGVQLLLLAALLTAVDLIVPSEHVIRVRLGEAGRPKGNGYKTTVLATPTKSSQNLGIVRPLSR